MPRAVLVQHHADERPARPLLAMRAAPRRQRHELALMQDALRPGVAVGEAVVLHQVLVEVLCGEAVVALAVELLEPLAPARRHALRRRLAEPPIGETGDALFLKPSAPSAKRPLRHAEDFRRLDPAQIMALPAPDNRGELHLS